MIEIDVSNRQAVHPIDVQLVVSAVRHVLVSQGIHDGSISVAVVDDQEMHELNRKHLAHDYPTDVLSFLYECEGQRIEGELIVSSETAAREAAELGWSVEDELLLYLIHGTLHLVGFDDESDAERQRMRHHECRYLAELGRDPAISAATARTFPGGDRQFDR